MPDHKPFQCTRLSLLLGRHFFFSVEFGFRESGKLGSLAKDAKFGEEEKIGEKITLAKAQRAPSSEKRRRSDKGGLSPVE